MELSDKEFKAHLAAYSKCDIEGGTASSDRMLFRAGYAAGIEYYRDGFYALLAALRPFARVADNWDMLAERGENFSADDIVPLTMEPYLAARAAIAKVRGQ